MNQIRKEYKLRPETELRCEISESVTLVVKLVDGSAEIFGIEMTPLKEYYFKEENFAIWTWNGCKLETTEENLGTSPYDSESPPMVAYINTHQQLEARRDAALTNSEPGPRVLIVGGQDKGKSSLARILSSYAARLDRSPLLVDLDIGTGLMGVPGSLGVVRVHKTNLSIEEGVMRANQPLCFFHGHTSSLDNPLLFRSLVDSLAQRAQARADKERAIQCSGMIIHTQGWGERERESEREAFDQIMHLILAFNVDLVLVLGHDKLHSLLSTALASSTPSSGPPSKDVAVLKMPFSTGAVSRSQTARTKQRQSRVRDYFYGRPFPPSLSLAPDRRELTILSPFDESVPGLLAGRGWSAGMGMGMGMGMGCLLLRAGGLGLPEGMRALGDAPEGPKPAELSPVSPTHDLLHSVLAVLHPSEDEEDIVRSGVAGFVVVQEMREEAGGDKSVLSILSPCPGDLPSRLLLAGNIKVPGFS